MSADPYRNPPKVLVEVRLVTSGSGVDMAAKELQDLMSDGFTVEAHSGARCGEYSTLFVWTMTRRSP